MVDFSPWFFIDAALFTVLAIGALYRLALKFHLDHFTVPRKSIVVHAVFSALASYSIVRATILVLIGVDRVPDNEGLSMTMFNMIPTVFFSILQTLLIAKWAGHVADIVLVLQHQKIRWGKTLVYISVGLVLIALMLVIAVVSDEGRASPLLSAAEWVAITDVYSGIIYIFNGAAFASLGIVLRSKWQPGNPEDLSACRRILGMAMVFGGVCIVRGAILLTFADPDKVKTVVYSSWGTPLVLLVEWIALVISLFGFTNIGPSAADPQQVEPMIGSSNQVLGSRKSPGSWRAPIGVSTPSNRQARKDSSDPVSSGALNSTLYELDESSDIGDSQRSLAQDAGE